MDSHFFNQLWASGRRARLAARTAALLAGASLLGACRKSEPVPFIGVPSAGLEYTNQRIARVPWSIHVVRVDRNDPALSLHSAHAQGRALGLSPLSQILRQLPVEAGEPVAAVNGDFYQRNQAYAGDPRGLQIVEGDLLSAPVGGVAFWADASGQLEAGAVTNQFQVLWPDGTSAAFGLNEDRRADRVVLYTPALADSTKTAGGRELILEPAAGKSWPPLAIDSTFDARVIAIREAGDSPLKPGTMVLSIGPVAARKLPKMDTGAELKLSTATSPSLRGARTAISGGPLLIHEGRRLKIQPPKTDSYEFSSMLERHPRTAIGWNATHVFLVETDGRQPGLSVGMTLEELGDYMLELGCTEAMNLDGGGSATLWFGGAVRNSPCDRFERSIANGLVVLRRASATPAPSPAAGR